MREFGTVPPLGLAAAAAAGTATAAGDVIDWRYAPLADIIAYPVIAITGIGWIVASYLTTMAMIERPASLSGGMRYTAASLVLTAMVMLPVSMSFLLIGTSTRSGFGAMMLLVTTCFVLVLAAFVLTALLIAWPIAQALSPRLIHWQRVLAAMHGIRWPLIASLIVTSGINRLVPSTETADTITDAALLASANGVADAASLLLLASIAVAAWRRGGKRDPALAPLTSPNKAATW